MRGGVKRSAPLASGRKYKFIPAATKTLDPPAIASCFNKLKTNGSMAEPGRKDLGF